MQPASGQPWFVRFAGHEQIGTSLQSLLEVVRSEKNIDDRKGSSSTTAIVQSTPAPDELAELA